MNEVWRYNQVYHIAHGDSRSRASLPSARIGGGGGNCTLSSTRLLLVRRHCRWRGRCRSTKLSPPPPPVPAGVVAKGQALLVPGRVATVAKLSIDLGCSQGARYPFNMLVEDRVSRPVLLRLPALAGPGEHGHDAQGDEHGRTKVKAGRSSPSYKIREQPHHKVEP